MGEVILYRACSERRVTSILDFRCFTEEAPWYRGASLSRTFGDRDSERASKREKERETESSSR